MITAATRPVRQVRRSGHRLREALRHPVSRNAMALYCVQLATFVLPLLTLPYTSRVLEPGAFGLVVFAQSMSFLLSLVVDFGFQGSATRQAATQRDDRLALGRLLSSVLAAKGLLSLASVLPALAVLAFVPKLAADPSYLVLAWIAAVANGLTPTWLLVGVERMRINAFVQLSFRVASSAATFALVTSPDDGWIVLALYAASSVAAACVTMVVAARHAPLCRTSMHEAFRVIREAWALFVSTAAVTLYTSVNVVLLGLVAPATQVAHFGAAERLIRATLQLIQPVATAAFPRLAYLQHRNDRRAAIGLLVAAGAAVALAGLAVAAALVVAAPLIVRIVFGAGYESVVPTLRIMAALIPAAAISAIASGWLMSVHEDRAIVAVVLRAGLLNIALGLVLAPRFGANGMAASVAIAEATATAGYLVAIARHEGLVLPTVLRPALQRLRGRPGMPAALPREGSHVALP